jgi:phosphate transport system substrate-binding protein
MKQIFSIGLLSFLLISFISCKKQEPKDSWTDTFTSGCVRIACDENFKNLLEAEIQIFEAHSNYNALILPTYVTETEAIRLLIDDSVRFALITRDLNNKERAEIEKKQMVANKHLIAFDGVALITNPFNPDSIIGTPTLKKILSGEITEWSEINPNSPLGAIRVIFDNQESGVLRYVADSIIKENAFSSNLYALNNDAEVIEKVTVMPNALGVIGVNFMSDDTGANYFEYKNKVRFMRVSKEEPATLANSFLPYAGDIAQENYPFWRPVYVLLSDPRSGLSAGFSVFLANEIGQKIILKSGLLPITDPQIMPVNIIEH